MKTAYQIFVNITADIIIAAILCLVVLWCIKGKEAPDVPFNASSVAQESISTEIGQIYHISAYCPCERCCGDFADGITASGANAEGKLIAAPKEIPFGTWIDIPNYGYAEVLDRGGAIKGRRLDVFFPTHQEALNWGVKYLRIKSLKEKE